MDVMSGRGAVMAVVITVVLATLCPAADPPAPRAPAIPTELAALPFTNAFVAGVKYRSDLPTPDQLLGFPAGTKAATSTEIQKCLQAWNQSAADRTRLMEYARSHEGRPLHLFFISSPDNLRRLDAIQTNLQFIGDPRQGTGTEVAARIESTPAVAWLAATIHGDETEGSDAMLAVIHHLLAAEDPEVQRLLEKLVVVVDPVMNPDGRDRFLKMIAEHRGVSPNLDEQSLLHSGYWPWGRGNHYLFDLNRDWLFAVHPETQGRMREVARWNPVLFVDAHGMGAQDTHLFSPSREPLNPHLPAHRKTWGEQFGIEQAKAFDAQGLVYYNGEWAEEWYPGYSDSWASYRGAVGILYEQARIAADGVRRPDGRILSYRESVWHHVIGALSNLRTAAAHAPELLRDLRAARALALDPAGPYAKRTFAILPTANASRLRALVEVLRHHGIELHRTAREVQAASATDVLGRDLKDVRLPAGTLLIPNRQPLGHLVAAILEFDPRMTPAVLEDERREILRTGGSRMYDTSAWSLPQLFGLPALTVHSDLPEGSEPLPDPTAAGTVRGPDSPIAWIFDGADDLSTAAAARLMERGVRVRASDRPFSFEGRAFERGSIVVLRLDNRTFAEDLAAVVRRTAEELGLDAWGTTTGLGAGDLPDLGGAHFARLTTPRIAIVGRDGASYTDYGSVWHAVDHQLGIRNSQLDALNVGDLGRYNVIILPDGAARDAYAEDLKDWVKQGGTLIAIESSTVPFTQENAHFSSVRRLPDVLGRLADYELAVLREWQAREPKLPGADQLWSHQVPLELEYPWSATDAGYPDEKELKRREAWQAAFMPAGTLLATRIDTNHWITAGCPEPLPVLADRGPILMAGEGVSAPIRYGYLSAAPPSASTNATPSATAEDPKAGTTKDSAPAKDAAKDKATDKEKDKDKESKVARVGWAALPPGTIMHLRTGGLLWPEASHRLAHAAWVTQERVGRGQVILFASPPTYRGGARGMTRVFLNAVVLGPGMGASESLRP